MDEQIAGKQHFIVLMQNSLGAIWTDLGGAFGTDIDNEQYWIVSYYYDQGKKREMKARQMSRKHEM